MRNRTFLVQHGVARFIKGFRCGLYEATMQLRKPLGGTSMARPRHGISTHAGILAGLLLGFIILAPLGEARPESRPPGATEREIAYQQEQQRRVQADTDKTVRRLQTMLRVLAYHQLDAGEEKRVLEEIATTLSSLSQEQMNEVIARLEAAAKAPDPSRSQQEMDIAYRRHREILNTLKGLLARYEAIKTLGQAADRLDKAGQEQLDLHLRTTQLAREIARNENRRQLTPAQQSAAQQLADRQADLQRDVAGVLRQLGDLRDQLPPDQLERLNQAEQRARELQVLRRLVDAAEDLRAMNRGNVREAREQQLRAAGDLRELARTLRPTPDRLAALREARERLDQAIQEQEALRQEAQMRQDPRVQDVARPRPDEAAQQLQELGDRQTRLEQEARDTRNLLRPHAQDVASRLQPAERAMQQAQEALRENQPSRATRPQDQALDALRDARNQLDRLIAEAERQQRDPLAALERAQQRIDQLLQQQREAQQQTVQAEAGKQPARLPEIAPRQQNLAEQTDALPG